MTKWIRVRDTSGHHISIRGDVPEGHPRGLQSGQQRLKQDAVATNGEVRPPTYRTDLGEKSASSAQITAKPRKSAKKKAAPEPVPTASAEQTEATSGHELADTERQD